MFGFPLGKGLLYMDEPYALIPNVLLSFSNSICSHWLLQGHMVLFMTKKTLTTVCASIIFDPVFND